MMKHLFFLGICLLMVACQQKAPTEKEIATREVDQALAEVVETHGLMGLSVILIDQGQTVYEGNFGTADLERNLPVNENTVYRIASISKTLTALALLQLVDAGKVDLSTDVSEYLGWTLRNPAHPTVPITLDLLLSHQSSIRDGEGYRKFSQNMINDQLHIQELLSSAGAYFTEDMFDDRAPGEYFSYTNCTWGIIAAIIELSSGERFDAYCKAHIFEPLGIGASFNVRDVEDLNQLAVLYRYKDSMWVSQADNYGGELPESRAYEAYEPGQNGLIFGPQGSLRASARDLATLIQFFLEGGKWNGQQLISPESLALMMREEWVYNGSNGDTWEEFWWAYGYGMHHVTNQDSADIIFPDRKMSGHPGIAYGLLSDMYFDVATQSGVVFITNGSKYPYGYGQATTFYQVEEDVFQVLFPYLN